MDKSVRGGGSADKDNLNFFFYIIIKFANVDRGGGKTFIHKMWIKRRVFFLNPSLRVIKPCVWVFIMSNKDYAVLSEYVACHNLRVFWVKNYSEILSV